MTSPMRSAGMLGRRTLAKTVIGVVLLFAAGAAGSAPAWASAADATPSPTPVEETTVPTPSPTPTDDEPATEEPAPPPTPEPTPDEPTASPSPTATTTPTPTPTPSVTGIPAVPPSFTTATIDIPTLIIAALTLVAGGLLLWALLRREHAPPPVAPGPPRTAEPVPLVLDAMASLGAAMIDSSYPVGPTRRALEEMAQNHGVRAAQAVIFPTSIMVSSGADDPAVSTEPALSTKSVQTRVVSAGDTSSLLYQIDAVDRIAGVARTRDSSAAGVMRALGRLHTLPAPFSRPQRIAAYALLSAALSVLLGSSWPGVALAAALGIWVGALLLMSDQLDTVRRALIVVGAALSVGIIVLLVARYVDPGVLPAVIAPLVMLLPGALLTIGVIELATGDIISGAARVAAGAMRLLLLSAGLVAAGALVGVPAVATTAWPFGPIMPWVAVAAFGVGMGIYQCARPASIGWIIVVLFVAYAAQVIGDVFFDGVLSALVGAAAMTPVAVVVGRLRTGPPAFVSFLPAFWLLVPGALGLIGAAGVLEGDSSGMGTLITTLATMVSVALGVLIGLAATGSVHGLRHAAPDEWLRGQLDEEDASGVAEPR